MLLALALSAGAANAQSTFGSVTGSVSDPTGAAVPGTTITAVHKTAGLTYTTESNDSGVFNLPDLRDGGYTIRATKQGFKEFIQEELLLEVRAIRRLDIRMEVGAVAETVEVTAGADAIETERATASVTRSEEYLTRTGLSSNGLWASFLTFPMTSQRGSSPSFAGTRNDQYQMTVDGASINAGTGGVISNLGGENQVFKDMHIDMVNTGAEHSGLAHVLLVTKSGENQVHGSAHFNYQSPAFRARDYFSTQTPTGINRRFGFEVGGPVFLPGVYNGKNRTFWHVAAEKVGGSQLRQELRPTVPLEPWRNGDFSALGVAIRNPITGDVYTDGRIPASAINPVSRKIQDIFYPLPNMGDTKTFATRNHQTLVTGPSSEERRFTAKLDQRISDKDYAYASFQVHQVDVNDWDGSLPAFDFRNWKRLTKSLAGVWTHTFNAQMLNEVRFSHAFNTYPRRGKFEGREIVSQLGLQGLTADLPEGGGLFKVNFSGLGITAISQTDQLRPGFVNNNSSIANDFSYFQGRHNLKMGFLFGWVAFDNQSLGANTFGQATFANTYSKVAGISNSGHAYADFLFGTPTSSNRGVMGPLEANRRKAYDFYIQDQWKAASWVTFTFGMRYEYHAPWTSVKGLFSTFDPSTGKVVVADAGMSAVSKFIPLGYVDVVSASSVGLNPKSLVSGDRNNFQPRLSAAFRPFKDNRTVISAGFTVAHDSNPFQPTSASSPFAVDEPVFNNTPTTPTVVLPVVFPSASSGRQPTMNLPAAAKSKHSVAALAPVEPGALPRAVGHGFQRPLRRHRYPPHVVGPRPERARHRQPTVHQ
ncbi:MAG TPA: TonB-dependent receptor [Bryobacteraceae bacterium]|nr:TonB-dependent receptor [Bryobacteraceae bacterium]